MLSLDRYLFRQGFTAFLIATLVVTAIVWTTQTLRYADIIVEHRESLAVLARISVLILPSLIAIILPFALFAASIFSIHRMHTDSEIAIMFASGVSRLRIGAPLILIAAGGALATLWVNIDLMPTAYRTLKREITDIRADFAASLLKPGEFTTFDNDFTIYVEEVRPDQRTSSTQFIGVLVNDYRDPEAPKIFMAQRGILRTTPSGPVLLLINGNIQHVAGPAANVEIVRFNETVLNAGEFMQAPNHDFLLQPTERYLGELFHPNPLSEWDRRNAGRLIAEGHNRLASPLYALAYVMIALYALMGGPYNRQGYGIRIAIAGGAAGALRIGGFVVQTKCAEIGANWLQYVVPVAAVIVLGALLTDIPVLRRRPALETN